MQRMSGARGSVLRVVALEFRRTLHWKQRDRWSSTFNRLSTTRAILHKCNDQVRIKLTDSESGRHAKQSSSILIRERCALQRTFDRCSELPPRVEGIKRTAAHALARLQHLVGHSLPIDRFRTRVGSWTLVRNESWKA